jgi:deoxyribonucleoside regulator
MPDTEEAILLADVASMYYEQNLTQEEIAKRIGVSRSGVSRLLTRSRELGLVHIQIRHPLQTSQELQGELMRRFGLHDAQVLMQNQPGENLLSKLGMLGARYLERILDEDMVLGISWGTSMLQLVNALHPVRRLRLDVVQLMGSISANSPDVDGPEIARRLATAYGANCYYLHAPLLVQSTAVRDALLQERTVKTTFEMMHRMDVALVGVGAVRGASSGLFRAGYLGEQELASIRVHGAVGDVCGHYFDAQGATCQLELHDRIISAPPAVLRQLPYVIGIAGGTSKAEALLGAMRARLVTVVITDEECVKAALALDDAMPLHVPPAPDAAEAVTPR